MSPQRQARFAPELQKESCCAQQCEGGESTRESFRAPMTGSGLPESLRALRRAGPFPPRAPGPPLTSMDEDPRQREIMPPPPLSDDADLEPTACSRSGGRRRLRRCH